MDLQQVQDLFQKAFEHKINKNYDESIRILNMIINEDIPNFLRAEYLFELGAIYFEKNDLISSKNAYINIKVEDDAIIYAWSQLILYEFDKEIKYLKNIKKDYDENSYVKAMWLLGVLEKSLVNKYKYWKNIPDKYEYMNKKYQALLLERIININTRKNQKVFYELNQRIDLILNYLFVDNLFENYIAHYTRLEIAKILLNTQDNLKKLRLNTVNLMNDPTEGLLIDKLIGVKNKKIIKDKAFIACFTLHHDSLNQFRLYGKEKK